MITDKEFLKAELEMGINPFNQDFINLCNTTLSTIESEITFESVLDYGAGVGAYADAFYKKGYKVSCYEHFEAHKEYMAENLPHLNIILKPITTDLMLFIEVAEHMTDKELKALFKKIKPKHILFSSTSEYKEGFDTDWGHINIKTQDQWKEMFEGFGYQLIKDLSIPTTWSKLYQLI